MDYFNAKDVLTGTEGECWVNGQKFAEVYGANAKITLRKEDVPMCGTRNGTGKKNMGWDGAGSFRMNWVNSDLLKQQVEAHKRGEELVFTYVSKLSNTKNQSERVVLKNCTFDEISLFDWESNKIIQKEMAFTFDDYDVLDYIL